MGPTGLMAGRFALGSLGIVFRCLKDHLHDRDERFIDGWCRWYPAFVTAILKAAGRLLPRRLYAAFEKFAIDTAELMGKFAGWCYCNVRDAGDIVRWLLIGT